MEKKRGVVPILIKITEARKLESLLTLCVVFSALKLNVPAKMSVFGLVYRLEPQKKLHCELFKLQYTVLEHYTLIFKQMLSPDNTNLNQNLFLSLYWKRFYLYSFMPEKI